MRTRFASLPVLVALWIALILGTLQVACGGSTTGPDPQTLATVGRSVFFDGTLSRAGRPVLRQLP